MEQIILDEIRGSPAEVRLHEAKQQQLLTLVGELLATNQELRFKVVELEQRAGIAENALNESTRWSGGLLL